MLGDTTQRGERALVLLAKMSLLREEEVADVWGQHAGSLVIQLSVHIAGELWAVVQLRRRLEEWRAHRVAQRSHRRDRHKILKQTALVPDPPRPGHFSKRLQESYALQSRSTNAGAAGFTARSTATLEHSKQPPYARSVPVAMGAPGSVMRRDALEDNQLAATSQRVYQAAASLAAMPRLVLGNAPSMSAVEMQRQLQALQAEMQQEKDWATGFSCG